MKIGDLVYSKKFGKGKIVCIAEDKLPYGIEFEKYNSELHDLDRKCKDGYGYWCTDDKNHNKPPEIITPYKFTKQDLKTGDKLTTRGGAELLYVGENHHNFIEISCIQTEYLQFLDELNEDLTMKDRNISIDDIVKVERAIYTTIFEREEEILDKKEKEYLAGVIRPFKDEVEYIVKHESGSPDNGEYILIRYEDNQPMFFPYFKKGTMYKGMELEKKYTLKELGLD